jgi:GT2 family glycosyltransferase
MKIAKMILHYATEAYTRSLLQQVPDAIVVDNGSPQPFEEAHIRQADLGFTRGWNAAIRAVYDDYDAFMLMNNDIDITSDVIDSLSQILGQHSDIGVISAVYNSYHKALRPQRMRWFRKIKPPPTGIRDVAFVELTAPLIKKRVFDTIGLFDERFAKGYGVDYDFAYRAWSAGFRIAVYEGARFYHHEHRSIKARSSYFRYRRAALKEMRRELKRKYGKNFFRADAFPFWNIGK